MSEDILLAVMNQAVMGQVIRRKGGKLSFQYDPTWVARSAFPLSFSMRLAETTYPDSVISPYLWNLLPDNEQIIQTWAKEFKVSARDVFGLIANVGQDVAGAVGFVSPERFDSYTREAGVQALTEAEIAERLRDLKANAALARRRGDIGKLSLAGAQSKTAFQRTAAGWALPYGRAPTTHIFKLPRPELQGHVENEHFCLRLAKRAGLEVAASEIRTFGGETVLVIERYDRVSRNGRVLRLHQEDLCQALKVHPAHKYEVHGGPGIDKAMAFLAGSGRPDDRHRFMEAIAFNFLVGGTDAHAKNYAVLMGMNSSMVMAPLYDLTSVFPYADRFNDLRLAMKIGGYDKARRILPRHFVRAAHSCAYPAERMLDTLRRLAEQLPDLAADTAREVREEGIDHPVLHALIDGIGKQCESTLGCLASGALLRG